MHEVSKLNQESLIPLYLSMKSEFPLIRSVIAGGQDGHIFVDNELRPESCIVFTKFGFTYYFGNQNKKENNAAIANLICNESILKFNYLLWYKPPNCWADRFDKFSEVLFRRRERVRYKFDITKFQKRSGASINSEYKIKKIDITLIKQTEHFNIDFPTRFWCSCDDFLKNGFGFCMLYHEKVVGICYAACVAGGLAEIDVLTIEEHRGNRIGTLLTNDFIAHCINNNIEPTWDCFSYNEPSKRIAETMGFFEKERYPFYSFNRPINQPDILTDILIWN